MADGTFAVDLLDVGQDQYGDAILCRFGDVAILTDGGHRDSAVASAGHRSIPEQVGDRLDQDPTRLHVTLLVVSHTHDDHIGCLPELVQTGTLTADWALVADPDWGFGVGIPDGIDLRAIDRLDPRLRAVAAVLREEPRGDETSEAALARFLDAASTVRPRYVAMLERLEEDGTEVVRYLGTTPSTLIDMLRGHGVDLRVLGPSRTLLLHCARVIAAGTHDAIDRADDLMAQDAQLTASELYRRLAVQRVDAADALDSIGHAVNCQSIVARLRHRAKKLLFTGDMQFAKPELNAEGQELVRRLRGRVKDEAPFAFVKLGHHGSNDAVNATILSELGNTRAFGICTGEDSPHHPNRATLRLLDQITTPITWARTDRNRLTTIDLNSDPPVFDQEAGVLNDAMPNSGDVVETETPTEEGGAESSPERPVVTSAATGAGDVVEVTARVPHVRTRVRLTIEVEPGQAATAATGDGAPPALPDRETAMAPSRLRKLDIRGGGRLGDLLFVTSAGALARNIGLLESAHLLAELRRHGASVLDDLPENLPSATAAAPFVRRRLEQQRPAGVVLIGGYDMLPADRLDPLASDLRDAVAEQYEPDDFIVWSDDVYGSLDPDGLPDLPVSRIPDARSPDLVFAAIQARREDGGRMRAGVRNIARPFADEVYVRLPGDDELATSRPVSHDQHPPLRLNGEQVYLMLHGDDLDGARFWGEDGGDLLEAVNVGTVPRRCPAVILAGCCWGALTASRRANETRPGERPGVKSLASSIALSFLQAGALAFVGCTGAHWSPVEEPYGYYGGPLHDAFWRRLNEGAAPAQALFDAKQEYIGGIPHGRPQSLDLAIEIKIVRQFTCLGLGW